MSRSVTVSKKVKSVLYSQKNMLIDCRAASCFQLLLYRHPSDGLHGFPKCLHHHSPHFHYSQVERYASDCQVCCQLRFFPLTSQLLSFHFTTLFFYFQMNTKSERKMLSSCHLFRRPVVFCHEHKVYKSENVVFANFCYRQCFQRVKFKKFID